MINQLIRQFQDQVERLINSLPVDQLQYLVSDAALFVSMAAGVVGIISTIMDA